MCILNGLKNLILIIIHEMLRKLYYGDSNLTEKTITN